VAKVSLIEREKKRAKLVAKFASKRGDLKAIINDSSNCNNCHATPLLVVNAIAAH
jgi:small subunit ribosomal protein S14